MSQLSLEDIAQEMRKIDITMMSTHTSGEEIAARPMSNNRDVDFDGTSYFFAMDDTRTISDISKNKNVGLTYLGDDGLQIALEGDAELVRDKSEFESHWNPDLDKWFEDGVDTDGLVMIKVDATRIHYWNGREEGETKV
ncbi:pyridoxamine 5'-phosphate oxidase family protein [Henriciella litoralis]|uniref:pyridoxamine 5'-phosphate oxidase family protein n=1 Tax=Henriciella litoralis TaxID=568102 RepID=UPI000A00BE0E|nr:pyridoxamine 5'-phosphate oxidase family protein [Henriciella litoralis]